jgi:hypothetical protein
MQGSKTQKRTHSRLVRLIYASDTNAFTTLEEMRNLLERAREHNREHGLTGFLVFCDNRFLQCLEGAPEEINSLYARILRDPRHGNVTLLDYRDISSRDFPQWDMGYAYALDPASEILGARFERGHFLPHTLDGLDATYLLRMLAAEVLTREQPPLRDAFESHPPEQA